MSGESVLDRYPSYWEITTLADICERFGGNIQTGPFGSQLHKSDYVEFGIPSIMPVNIGENGVDETGIARIRPEDAERLSKYRVKPGDIIYSRRGDVERCALITQTEKGWLCGTGCLRVRPGKGGLSSRFTYYYLRHPSVREWIVRHAHGATMPNLNTTILGICPFLLPPMRDQEAIADLLGPLDDKIDLNRRMNETLEAMARAIFKDWFVDFGPTRAKAEGRAPYLAPEIWDLFPEKLDDDEKPVGWESFTLADLAHHHRATVSPSADPEHTFEHYSIPGYDTGNAPTLDLGGSIRSNKTVVPEGAVLLSKLNPEIERVWLPGPKGELSQVASTEFLAFTPLACATRTVLFCMFKSEAFRAEMAAMVTGTSKSHQRVSPKVLITREVLTTDPQLLTAFDEIVRPFLDRLLANRREARTLAQTRDLLLPKLMSGEIRLAEAEKAVA